MAIKLLTFIVIPKGIIDVDLDCDFQTISFLHVMSASPHHIFNCPATIYSY